MDAPLKPNYQIGFGTQNTLPAASGKPYMIEQMNEISVPRHRRREAKTVQTGKDYLRARTLNRGCPKLLKMVNQWSRERPTAQQQPISLSFNYYS